MRLWTLHPKYLDARGLVALWREGLLARAVLRGATRGYRHHPQLHRFLAHASPRLAIRPSDARSPQYQVPRASTTLVLSPSAREGAQASEALKLPT